MHQHLSEKARDILSAAQKLAHEEQLEYVGTEHVLLAILDHADCLAAQILRDHGVDFAHLRKLIEARDTAPREETLVFGRLPGSPHFQHAVSTAIREADRKPNRGLGTDCILLALAQQEGSAAQKALAALGLNHEILRQTACPEEENAH